MIKFLARSVYGLRVGVIGVTGYGLRVRVRGLDLGV